MALRALYWGEETNKDCVILIDGTQIAEERRAGPPSKAFVARDYPIPVDLTRGEAKVRVRIETRGTDAPVYEVRMIESEARCCPAGPNGARTRGSAQPHRFRQHGRAARRARVRQKR